MSDILNQKFDTSTSIASNSAIPTNILTQEPSALLASIDDELETLLNFAQTNFGHDQLVQAKEDFFWLMGKVFHDDDFYETRMTYFIDSFLLERPVKIHGRLANSPLYIFQQKKANSLNLISYRHSIFQIKKLSSSNILVHDLLERQPLEIVARPDETFKQLERKQLFQGFVYRTSQGNFLSRGVLYHPSRAAALILKAVKQSQSDVNTSFLKILGIFAKQHLRYLRHPHIDPRRIYADASGN